MLGVSKILKEERKKITRILSYSGKYVDNYNLLNPPRIVIYGSTHEEQMSFLSFITKCKFFANNYCLDDRKSDLNIYVQENKSNFVNYGTNTTVAWGANDFTKRVDYPLKEYIKNIFARVKYKLTQNFVLVNKNEIDKSLYENSFFVYLKQPSSTIVTPGDDEISFDIDSESFNDSQLEDDLAEKYLKFVMENWRKNIEDCLLEKIDNYKKDIKDLYFDIKDSEVLEHISEIKNGLRILMKEDKDDMIFLVDYWVRGILNNKFVGKFERFADSYDSIVASVIKEAEKQLTGEIGKYIYLKFKLENINLRVTDEFISQKLDMETHIHNIENIITKLNKR